MMQINKEKKMTSSRKRKILTLEEKVKAIRLSEKGDSSRKIAVTFDVGKTQINSLIKDNQKNILTLWENGMNGDRKIVKAKRCLYPDINEAVYEWFQTARGKNIPVSGKMIQEKAIIIFMEMGLDDFTASNGWLYKFQQRHNIKCSSLKGESALDKNIVELYEVMSKAKEILKR